MADYSYSKSFDINIGLDNALSAYNIYLYWNTVIHDNIAGYKVYMANTAYAIQWTLKETTTNLFSALTAFRNSNVFIKVVPYVSATETVSTGYNDTATTIVLSSGHGANLPNTSTYGAFYVVWWNSTDYTDPFADPYNEIVKVTTRATDTLTVVRGQKGTKAVNHNTGGKTYKMTLTFDPVLRKASRVGG